MYTFLHIYKEKVNLPFKCNARADLCDAKVFAALKEANCDCVQFGLESGDSDMRENLLDRHMSDAAIINAFKLAKEYKIRTAAYVMIGLPEETPKRFIKTIKLIANTGADNYYLFVFRPYQSTKLYDYCKAHEMLQKKINNNFIEWQDSILEIPGFNKKDISYYHDNIVFLVNLYRKFLKTKRHKFIQKVIFDIYCVPPSNWLVYYSLRILLRMFSVLGFNFR
jgi:radical SAM superfamily enzyme YgiQ (UPF0313 family)